MLWWFSLAIAAQGDAPYLEALKAWDEGHWEDALTLSQTASSLEPGHRAARLLEGYALFRLGRKEEGTTVLRALSAEPAEGDYQVDIRRRSDHLWKRWVDRARRDQVAVGLGGALPVQTTYGSPTPLLSFSATVEVPLPGPVGVKADFTLPPSTSDIFGVRGPLFGAAAVYRQPLGRGVWSADLTFGPRLWLARGGYWEDGTEPYLGARLAVGADVRLSRRVGFAFELGGAYYPGIAADLPWLGMPVDSSVNLVVWFGK